MPLKEPKKKKLNKLGVRWQLARKSAKHTNKALRGKKWSRQWAHVYLGTKRRMIEKGMDPERAKIRAIIMANGVLKKREQKLDSRK